MSLFVKGAPVALAMLAFSVTATGAGAAAQETAPVPVDTKMIAPAAPVASSIATPVAESLAALVAAEGDKADISDEITCLAGAIYFEARNEPLVGQLAVGRVIVNRSTSGRFPASYCGVVNQPSQFSFVRHHAAIKTGSRSWHDAVALARIAHEGRWQSPAEGALYFHAARIRVHWAGRVRVAQIENHIFYR